jgi:glycosyltransferase involved in cell wall biosynthesis
MISKAHFHKKGQSNSERESVTDTDYPILVHSHLRWDWVWQRPQQFLSRLSKRHPILFVEEPAANSEIQTSRMDLSSAEKFPNIHVLRTELPAKLFTNRAAVDAEQKRLVETVLRDPLGSRFERPVQWFYDPMATPTFVGSMNERLVVYDCMDQLSQFRGAPAELVRRERELLTLADVVFAGGPKIYKAKRELNNNCYCYGCGVDVTHFGQARVADTEIPADIAGTRNVFGYFGVVDERLDYDLLARLADADKDWNIVVVGPVAKVDPETFPKRKNLHWLGGRDYSQLPGYVKGFDVCMMPFAINEATEFINPTKALEYMATGRPIVSTAVEDVVLQFSEIVHVADSPTQFIEACRESLANPKGERIEAGLQLAKKNSWEAIVARLEGHIEDALNTRSRSEVRAA